MYTVTLDGNRKYKTDLKSTGSAFEGTINDESCEGDLVKLGENRFHLLLHNRSYNIEVLHRGKGDKNIVMRINGQKITADLRDKYDDLLQRLGMDEANSRKVNDVKAPMPGMVLNVLVAEGAEVKKGDALLVLEAMKMENILKSPCDGTVKKVVANKGTAVEKNQLLIQF